MRSSNQSVYSVGQVNSYIKNMFAQDFMLSRIYVRGEVSNCKYHTSGHLYFSLKDASGTIACVMFAGQRRGLAFRMKDGDKVIVGGSVNVYERDGKYQLYAREISLEGAGLLYERFLALKKELEEMGMFALEYKQPIPFYVKRLGVVTAPTGAVIQDIRNVAYRRNPYVQIVLYPALVQGEGAVESIVRGIETLDRLHLDVLIVGRGGGSIEDLWAFNEEPVARAIFNCETPVISAVGHETDTTIADYVADLRAPTPSAAAELAVTDIRGILERMDQYRRRMNYSLQTQVQQARTRLQSYQARWNYLNPVQRLEKQKDRLADAERRLQENMEAVLQNKRHRLELYIRQMQGLSPLDKLNQGFSYVENQEQRPVTRIAQVQEGELLKIQVTDGTIEAEVKAKRQRQYAAAGNGTERTENPEDRENENQDGRKNGNNGCQ
ncbi:exodeoxyribonuclease VII large subunit [Lacrimispora saccharolytica]|nr:exodeoxyribonuclease VII large subunit [Lacrimispora saccharolytica]MBS6705469.1 exodeoxyribonuclease VII large subunit [Lachnospiraceae bacterium]MDM8247186.1 exodeoxyribonuclease VII large subunit [Lacrimispora saccharolytica]